MWILQIVLLFSVYTINGSDFEILFSGNEAFTEKININLLKLFPKIQDLLEMRELFNVRTIQLSDIRKAIGILWFSLVEQVATKIGDIFQLDIPLSIRKQRLIFGFVKKHITDDRMFCEFIDAGMRLLVPDEIMDIICNFYMDKLLKRPAAEMKNTQYFSPMNGDLYHCYSKTLIPIFYNLFMLHEELFAKTGEVKDISGYKIPNTKKIKYCACSKKGEAVCFLGDRKPNGIRAVSIVNCREKSVTLSSNKHIFTDQAKNRNSFVRAAALVPRFLTICPYDDRILMHDIADKTKNIAIPLQLQDGDEIKSCDISGDGTKIIVGININYGKDTVFNIYSTEAIHNANGTLNMKRMTLDTITHAGITSPETASLFNPSDSSIIFCEFSQFKQYISENGRVYGSGESVPRPFTNVKPITYNFYGTYLFLVFARDLHGRGSIYRIEMEDIEKPDTNREVPADLSNANCMVNESGDLAVITVPRVGSRDYIRVFIVNYITGEVYELDEENVTSVSLDGYCLVYAKSYSNERSDIIAYDTLYKRELVRWKKFIESTDIAKIAINVLGITQEHYIVAEYRVIKMNKGIDSWIVIHDMLKQCAFEILRNVQNGFFIGNDAWLKDLIELCMDIKTKKYDSVVSLFTSKVSNLNQEFLLLCQQCGIQFGEKIKTQAPSFYREASRLGAQQKLLGYGKEKKKIEEAKQSKRAIQAQHKAALSQLFELKRIQQPSAVPTIELQPTVPTTAPSVPMQQTQPSFFKTVLSSVTSALTYLGSLILSPFRAISIWLFGNTA